MSKEYIAYQGTTFTIEWYFNSNGISQALEFYLESDSQTQDKIMHLFKLMGNIGVIHNIEKFRNEGNQIYAFKRGSKRLLCFFFCGSKIVITNAFTKKISYRQKKNFEL